MRNLAQNETGLPGTDAGQVTGGWNAGDGLRPESLTQYREVMAHVANENERRGPD